MQELTGKKALVTGSTTGIGAATVRLLAARGASVVVHGRDAERGERVAAEIRDAGGDARFVRADLRSPEDVARLASDVGHVDILVNNAAMGWFGPSAAIELHELDALFEANVRATYLLTTALAPSMLEAGEGSIVNLSSGSGLIGQDVGAAYGATKAAIDSLTRALAAEYGPSGVRVNAVAPGATITNEAFREPAEAYVPTIPLRRTADPAEIAEVIAFLAGPKSSYMTATTVPVDGGRTAV